MNFAGLPQDELSIHLLDATLRQLPRLERLWLTGPSVPQTMVLPPGPWQGTLKQLSAADYVLAASLPVLSEASSLQELSMKASTARERHDWAAALRVLRWVAERQAAPLQRLSMPLFMIEHTAVSILRAFLAVKERHPHITIVV